MHLPSRFRNTPSQRRALSAANGERSNTLGEMALLLVVLATMVVRGC